MYVGALVFAEREYEGHPKPRLDPADHFQIGPKANVGKKTAIAVILVVQRRLTGQFKHRDQLLNPRDVQFVVLNRIAKNETVFERLQSPILARPSQSGIAYDGLKREVIAQPQVIEDFRNDLGILAYG